MYILAVVALAATTALGGGEVGQNVTVSLQEFSSIETCQTAKQMFIELQEADHLNVNATCLAK